MSATKSKPAGRAVRVRRRHAYIAGGEIQEIRATPAGAIHAMMDHGCSEADYCSPVITITNPPPGLSCKKLKRLVEIAGMDYGDLACLLEDVLAKNEENRPYLRTTAIIEALGLSTAQGRKGAK